MPAPPAISRARLPMPSGNPLQTLRSRPRRRLKPRTARPTYTVSFSKQGYAQASIPGVIVLQDQTQRVTEQLQAELKTIATVHAAGSSNLVKPNEGSDVYTISGQQLTAATNPINALQTIYEWFAVTPGVTANGFPAQPRIRGGQVTDLGYEFEGIPIQDRIVGFFTTNLSNTGL